MSVIYVRQLKSTSTKQLANQVPNYKKAFPLSLLLSLVTQSLSLSSSNLYTHKSTERQLDRSIDQLTMIIELPPNLPVGVRFHPTDQELITRYLRPKILGHHFDDAIAEINLCDWEPWELPRTFMLCSKDMIYMMFYNRPLFVLFFFLNYGFWFIR